MSEQSNLLHFPHPPDVIALLEEGLRAMPPRGDEGSAHASDVVCDRQTWARRRGEEMLPHEFRTLMKFELGRQFERGVADILEAQLTLKGYAVYRDVTTSLNGVLGHLDLEATDANPYGWLRPFILEIKSTSFLRGKVPEAPSPWYVEQAAVYATARNIARFGILVGCRESGKLAPIFWFNLDDQRYDEPQTWREWAEARAKELIAVTDPSAPMPPAAPRTAWGCKTCPWAGCEKNPAYVDGTIYSKLEESYAERVK